MTSKQLGDEGRVRRVGAGGELDPDTAYRKRLVKEIMEKKFKRSFPEEEQQELNKLFNELLKGKKELKTELDALKNDEVVLRYERLKKENEKKYQENKVRIIAELEAMKKKLQERKAEDDVFVQTLVKGEGSKLKIIRHKVMDYASMSRHEVMKCLDENNPEQSQKRIEAQKSLLKIYQPKLQVWNELNQMYSNSRTRMSLACSQKSFPKVHHFLVTLNSWRERPTFIKYVVNNLRSKEQAVVFTFDKKRLNDLLDEGLDAELLDNDSGRDDFLKVWARFQQGHIQVLLIFGKFYGLPIETWENVSCIIHDRPHQIYKGSRPEDIFHKRNSIWRYSSLSEVIIYTVRVEGDSDEAHKIFE